MIDDKDGRQMFISFFQRFKAGYPQSYPNALETDEYFRKLLPYEWDVVRYAFDKAAAQSRDKVGKPELPSAQLTQDIAKVLQADKERHRGQDLKRPTLPPRAPNEPVQTPQMELGLRVEREVLEAGKNGEHPAKALFRIMEKL